NPGVPFFTNICYKCGCEFGPVIEPQHNIEWLAFRSNVTVTANYNEAALRKVLERGIRMPLPLYADFKTSDEESEAIKAAVRSATSRMRATRGFLKEVWDALFV